MTTTNTFWMTSYLRAALPALASIGFNLGFAINVTMTNVSSPVVLLVMVGLMIFGKMAFSHLSSKEDYLWFLDESDLKKNRFFLGYARVIGVGVFLGATLMSMAQHSSSLALTVGILLTASALFITEGLRFEKATK